VEEVAVRIDVATPWRKIELLQSSLRWSPGLLVLRKYQAAWLPHDIIAGLVLATTLVPVGIAYAGASGVPGIYGLYATIVPLLAYALFRPSRVPVLGPDASLAVVILGVVAPLSGGDAVRAVALAGMMAVVSGIACILAGAARLGFALSRRPPVARSGLASLGCALVLRQRRVVQRALPGCSGEVSSPSTLVGRCSRTGDQR
jgi:MFS superfamily sulfate permease-like transporter